jgi:acyl carrier protein phosphodiesterase
VDNVKLMNVEDMRQAIGTLYSHIFHFLKSAMKWYQSNSLKKVLNSFNESFYDKFEEQIVKIKSLSEWLQKKGNLKSRAELRDLRLVVDQMAKQNARICASLREEKQNNDDWQNIGQSMLRMLRSSTEAWRFNPELRLPDVQPQGDINHIYHGQHQLI